MKKESSVKPSSPQMDAGSKDIRWRMTVFTVKGTHAKSNQVEERILYPFLANQNNVLKVKVTYVSMYTFYNAAYWV